VEELLIRRFAQLSREEIRAMFQLHDLRKTRVWQEAQEEGLEKGREEGQAEGIKLAKKELVQKWLAKGKKLKEVAELLDLPLEEVRRLAKD
jgi:predicted transposase/invertase (TIGR01784 family)